MLYVFLLIVAVFACAAVSHAIEKNHYRSIGEREVKLVILPVVTTQDVIRPGRSVEKVQLVYSSAVISVNYFKRVEAAIRNFFGDEIVAYRMILERARREAVLRMKEKVPTADIIINLRIETTPLGNSYKSPLACAEVLAWGTAITYSGAADKRIKEQLRLDHA